MWTVIINGIYFHYISGFSRDIEIRFYVGWVEMVKHEWLLPMVFAREGSEFLCLKYLYILQSSV